MNGCNIETVTRINDYVALYIFLPQFLRWAMYTLHDTRHVQKSNVAVGIKWNSQQKNSVKSGKTVTGQEL